MTPAAPTKLEEAILFAVTAHLGQKHVTTGLPYILHPLRVMNRVRRAGGNETAMITAVLHDVLEDTDASAEIILEKFGKQVLDSVTVLTRPKGDSYTQFINLIGSNRTREITVLVKLADIADNLELGKTNPLPDAARQERLTKRYLAAQKHLKSLPLINTEPTDC
jgi:(p)ppGpp synthase/HD superfamily hydrolase